MKHSKNTRYLTLMSKMGWLGVSRWDIVDETFQKQHIIPFKKWLKDNLGYLPSPEVRQAVVTYYFDGESVNNKSQFYHIKEMGTEALCALYRKEKEIKDGS